MEVRRWGAAEFFRRPALRRNEGAGADFGLRESPAELGKGCAAHARHLSTYKAEGRLGSTWERYSPEAQVGSLKDWA